MTAKISHIFRYSLFLISLSLSGAAMADKYETINWVDLLPEKDLKALENPPDYINEVEDGSAEDSIVSQFMSALEESTDPFDDYQLALISTDVVDEFDGRNIRLPGFIVPVEMDEKQRVTEFFLVPYFGACIHLPPPPPNQIVYVTSDVGIPIINIYEAYWIDGTINTTYTENDLAQSAYSMTAANIEIYTDE
jgi:hypothetical protein